MVLCAGNFVEMSLEKFIETGMRSEIVESIGSLLFIYDEMLHTHKHTTCVTQDCVDVVSTAFFSIICLVVPCR